MKPLCVLLSLAILLTGCYSHTTLTAEGAKSEYEVIFRLKDGTDVRSSNYERVENGYKVVGTLISTTAPIYKDFAGIVSDAQIKEIVTNEFDAGMTVGVVFLVVGLVALATGLAIKQNLREW